MIREFPLIFIFALFLLGAGGRPLTEEGTHLTQNARLEGQVHAPEIPPHLSWLNTDRSLSLAQLKGKIVLLDFWTFCCINCMHVIPDLKKLEAKYPKELVVIGVHSAKFTNEKDTESIRQAILRYEIKHPVVNDKDFEVWRAYDVHAWPTLVLVNPNGRIIGTHSGEDIFDLFDQVIGQAVSYFDRKGELKRGALDLALEEAKQPNTLLAFPGKISADAIKNRLVISDSNHNRVLLADPDGRILEVIGNGKIGTKDGSFEEAEFNHPQGTFVEGNILYIADTENHLIRTADLVKREVRTLLGTGQKSALNSPWDLLGHEGKLYIAMAGPHQLWVADLATLEARPHAGSGREARIDGPLLQAALAQPSGITTDGRKLYFADSEVSSIRTADIDTKGKVETIVGEDLFEYGDVDGPAAISRLQHALGVVFHEGMLYVADTYNSKIKLVDPQKKTSVTYAGTGKQGIKGGERLTAEFREPGGLAVLGDRLYIADTNNHAIRVLDLKSGNVKTLEFSGIEKITIRTMEDFKGRLVLLPVQQLKEGKSTLRLSFNLPEGYKFAANAPFYAEWKSGDEKVVRFPRREVSPSAEPVRFPLEIPFEASRGSAEVTLHAMVYYCRSDSSVCLFDAVHIQTSIEVGETGSTQLSVEIDVEVIRSFGPGSGLKKAGGADILMKGK